MYGVPAACLRHVDRLCADLRCGFAVREAVLRSWGRRRSRARGDGWVSSGYIATVQRIVAGHLRGRRLRALPAEVAVRPTAARVREAIFSRLFDRVVGVTVLDLFAGSGACTFEALSRGAERAIAVDHDAAVIRHLRAQSEDFSLSTSVECVHQDACAFLRCGRGSRTPIGLVFIDPPYADVALPSEVLVALVAGGWLRDRAEIILERARVRGQASAIELAPGFHREAVRDYGQTSVEFLRGPALSR